MKQQLTPKQEAFAIETLKNILHLFHEKRYDEVPGAVDESEIDDQCDGFSLDYEMTSGAELCQLVLQLAFLYQPDGSLRRVFQCVDPQ